jgi:hypothetical protein
VALRVTIVAILLLIFWNAAAAPSSLEEAPQVAPPVPSSRSPLGPPRVDVYVLPTNVNGNQPCAAPNSSDIAALRSMIATQLLPNYTAAVGVKVGPDYLSPGNYPRGLGAFVIIASVCKALSVYAITINGYALGKSSGDQTSGSLSGTFDALESSDWSNLFGMAPMVPNVAFLPIPNDTNNFINPRLVRNLSITVLATPAPAPIAPSPPGQPPPPLPPSTRLKECQSSDYQMLVVGRALITSTNNDISRVIVAGSALQFRQPTWGGYYQGAGAILGLLYNPASADVSVDFFICPKNNIPFSATDSTAKYKAGNLYQVGGADAHITGHHVTTAIGVNPYANQTSVDLAAVDLANQLDCIIWRELQELQVKDWKLKQGALYGDNDLGKGLWCDKYFRALKALEGPKPPPVIRPTKSLWAPVPSDE